MRSFNIPSAPKTVCTRYQQSISEDQAPHLVFDTTISGLASETVKSFTSALALPTVSASFGQEGDLRQWREITANSQESFLLQVMPPADMIPEVVRAIVQYVNITNAAILYDETFGEQRDDIKGWGGVKSGWCDLQCD